ncbi:MAG: VOC family protein [Cytophagaceae bacterium]|nr:VOC family protein [Cytophagaceae bacterium]MBP6094432.1 VOC family protein [Cytophagaceae bacterium]
MLNTIIPKLPMRDKCKTQAFYLEGLGFEELADYGDYLLLKKDEIEIHFFEFPALNPLENYGQVYIRTNAIAALYRGFLANNISIHPNGPLASKPWGQQEFSLLDPDHNLLTFGEALSQ